MRRYQKIHTYRFEEWSADGVHHKNRAEIVGVVQTDKSSFKTLESAIDNAMFFIEKREGWIDTTVLEVKIVDKETKEVVWEYKKEA